MQSHNRTPNSLRLYKEAQEVLPGGTTRFTVATDPSPIYIAAGQGAWLTDVDDNRYLDLGNNYTALIHGHGFQPVVDAVAEAIRHGSCFANPTEHEIKLAGMLCERVPGLDKLRFVNTGTEATMFAVKAARAYTGRTKVAKFEGAYHGGYDYVETSEHSAPGNWGPLSDPARVPYAAGTPDAVLADNVILPFNDIDNTLTCLERAKSEIACLLVDVMPSRAGLIGLEPDYVATIQRFCNDNGILILCDEVLNFRQGYHGAAAEFGLRPDLITIGKIIGGGLPIGLVGGSDAVMQVFSGKGRRAVVPQGGTFAANPISLVAGIAAMTAWDPAAVARLNAMGERVRDGLRRVIADAGAPMSVTGGASLFRLHMRAMPPRTYREFYPSAEEQAVGKLFHQALLGRGILMPPTSSSCLSTPMTDADLDFVLDAVDATLRSVEYRAAVQSAGVGTAPAQGA